MVQAEILKDFTRDGAVTLQVKGDCMRGTFPDGAEIRVEKRAMYWPGDVLAYERGDGLLVSHRLLGYVPGRDGWRVVTRADQRSAADSPAALNRVLGCVTKVDGRELVCSGFQRVSSVFYFLPAALAWAGRRVFNEGK